MKKKIWLGVALACILACSAVAGMLFLNKEKVADVISDAAKLPAKIKDVLTGDKEPEKAQKTLMIYMIGSDLEARSGAGTDDLEEITASGMDTDKVNVLVYTGGAARWHNELVNEKGNSILHLTKDGFEVVKTSDAHSMGSPESLTEFLNYAHENYPSESYALIMWNHGNGPLIGYGKDMLFEDDSLTLAEMRSALDASPFDANNKLDWVGFDACLMSSAELVCVWDDYANYLVASQEIEPSFGWDYAVFKNYAGQDTVSFLTHLIDGYMSACQSYYDKRGYEDRDTTLACINLAYGRELESAIDALFSTVSAGMPVQYNDMVQKRVMTRALGRASTGSEYDLIDLNDMALQLEASYPNETATLMRVIQKMVVKNGNNTQGCCGMSLYYPFYNKYYYEDSWGAVYAGLDLLKQYGAYLDQYQDIWLHDDQLDRYEASPVPQKVEDDPNRNTGAAGTYKLVLSPRQNEYYADAKYYILKKSKGDLYHPVFSSENVVYENGTLYADFDGKAIYARDNYNNRSLPVTIENDAVGNKNRYTLKAVGNVWMSGNGELTALDFQTELNRDTQQVGLNAIVDSHAAADARALSGGKQKEYSIGDFPTYGFYYGDYRYLQRYANGLIMPIAQWIPDSGLSVDVVFNAQGGLFFTYEPIDAGVYYLMFEITDTRGSKYCSELVEVETEGYDASLYETQLPQMQMNWTQGDKLELASANNVTVYLKWITDGGLLKDQSGYTLEVVNENDFPVVARFENLVCNGENLDLGNFYLYINPNSTLQETNVLPSENLLKIGAVDEIRSLEGALSVEEGENYYKLLQTHWVTVDIAPELYAARTFSDVGMRQLKGPYLDALAESQLLYEDARVRVSLLTFGDYGYDEQSVFCYENLTSEQMRVCIDGVCVNGVTMKINKEDILLPNRKIYKALELVSPYDAPPKTIESLSVHVTVHENLDFNAEPSVSAWLPIVLKAHGTAEAFVPGEQVVFDRQGVRIILDAYKTEDKPTWYATVINDSDRDIYLQSTYINDTQCAQKVGAHQRANMKIVYNGASKGRPLTEEYAELFLRIYDWHESVVLDETLTPIRLEAKEKPVETEPDIHLSWETGELIQLFEQEGVHIYLWKNPKNVKPYLGTDATGAALWGEAYEGAGYALVVQNKNDSPVDVTLDRVIVNGDTQNPYTYILFDVAAGDIKPTALSFQRELYVGALTEVNSLSGNLKIQKSNANMEVMAENKKITVTMSDETKLCAEELGSYAATVPAPYFGATATEQVLWETELARVTLLWLGNTDTENAMICFENLTEETCTVAMRQLVINGLLEEDLYRTIKIAPRCKVYESVKLKRSAQTAEEPIESVEMYFRAWKGEVQREIADDAWVSVNLAQKGDAPDYVPGGELILQRDGVSVYINGVTRDAKTNAPQWSATVVNANDYGIKLTEDFGYGDALMEEVQIGPHQRGNFTIKHRNGLDVNRVQIKFEVKEFFADYLTDEVLFASEAIILKAE